jgi:hypothetical protein
MKKLQKVTLEKSDTCLTYVLKRLGLESNLCSYENLHKNFEQVIFKGRKLKTGDILLWDKTIEWEWLPWKIDDGGIISWKSVPVGFHFGIVEDDTSKFSDCTRLVRPPHPTIRLREIKDLRNNPDWILIYNNDKNNE